MKLLLFCSALNKIGGIERFCLNFCKRLYKTYEITFLYDTADEDRLVEISHYATPVKFTEQHFNVDECIYGTAWGTRPENNIIAKEYMQVLHADYRNVIKNWSGSKLEITPKTTKVISVGQSVADSVKELYNIDSTVIYNLLDDNLKPEQVVRFITCSRISPEKGFERIVEMVKKLKKSGKRFIWYIYGDTTYSPYKDGIVDALKEYEEVVFMGSKIDVTSEILSCDYLVQLSDTEGFCYTIYEALALGVPCITTDFESASEQIIEGENGYILDMKLSNLDIDKIYKNIPKGYKFKEKSTEKDWIKVFGEPNTKPSIPIPLTKKEAKQKPALVYNNAKGNLLGY